MKKILKFVAYLVAGIASLLILLIVVLKLIPDTQYKQWITRAAESATGRDVSIANLELDFGSAFRLRADDVRLSNAEWGSQNEMLNIDRVEVDFGLFALLAAKADIRAVISKANILAENNADGISNWQISSKNDSEPADDASADDRDETSGLPLQPFIREIRVDDLALTVISAPNAVAKTVIIQHLLIETPEKDTTLALKANVQGRELQLSGNLGDMQQFLDTASEPMQLNGDLFGNALAISGNWGPLLPAQFLDINIDLQIPDTRSLSEIAGLQLDTLGAITVSGKLTGTENLLSVDPLNISLLGEHAEVDIKGSISDLKNVDGIDISADASSHTLQQLLKQLNIETPLEIPSDVALNARIEGNLREIAMSNLVLEIQDEGLSLTANASVGDLLKYQEISGTLNGTVDSLSRISKYTGLDLPNLGEIELSAELASEDKSLQLNNINARLISDNINFTLAGQVADVLTVKGIDALAELEILSFSDQNIADLSKILKQFKVDLPREMLPQSARLKTRIRGDLEKLSINELQAEVLDQGLKITLDGEVENILTSTGVKANMVLNSESIATFSKYAGSELPDLGPLQANATLSSEGTTYRLDKMTLNLDDEILKADLLASVADLMAVTGVKASLTGATDSLDTLSDLAQTELPETDPLEVKFDLDENTSGKPDFNLLAQTGDAQLRVQGQLESLAIPDSIGLIVSLTAAKMADFNKVAQYEFTDDGPLDLSTHIQLEKNNFSLSDIKLQLADQSATGQLSLQLPVKETELTMLNGNIDIDYLDLSFLIPEPSQLPIEESNTEGSTVETAPIVDPTTSVDSENADIEPVAATLPVDRLFSTEPILLEKLNNYDVDVSISANQLDFGKTNLQDVLLELSLKEGLLNLDPIHASGGAGNIKGYFRIDGRKTVPELDVDLAIKEVPMPNLGGKLDFNLDVTGKGESVAELMGSLNGQALLVARDGRIENSLATSFGTGLLSFSGTQDYTELECAILRVDIVDGLADFDNKLAAQLSDVTWRGGGEINLKTEQLEVGIRPKARKGIPISVGSLASLVYIGGTLKSPKAQLDPTDVAIKYAKYSAYLATGGLSFVAEAIKNRVQANQDVCEKILNGTVFDAEEKPENDASSIDAKQVNSETESSGETSSTEPVEQYKLKKAKAPQGKQYF